MANSLQEKTINLNLVEIREHEEYHKSYTEEKQLFQCITEGKKAKMLESFYEFNKQGNDGTLSKKCELRSKKNLFISAVTLATRAAMEGGLYPEVAYTLSDIYIQTIEEVNSIEEIDKLLIKAFTEFTERVEKIKRTNLTKTIFLCQEYIFNHLYDDLSLTILAEHLHTSPSYLSARFKKEAGISMKEFITNQRIEEAKKLIRYSDYTLAEIYTLLNFHDQSYFTKVFKKNTGCTPKQFKNASI